VKRPDGRGVSTLDPGFVTSAAKAVKLFLLSAVVLALAVGCGGNGGGQAEEADTGETTAAEAEQTTATEEGDAATEDGDAAPLTLEQRILRQTDAPRSKPDPVEPGWTVRSLKEAVADPEGLGAHIGRAKLEEIGFVAAIEDVRFWPTRPDGRHTPDAPHVRMVVVEVRDEESAQKAVEVLRAEARRPCPGECAIRRAEFDTSAVPDAQGLHRFARAQDIEALGEEGEPFDSFSLWFADGPFAYELEVFGEQRAGDAAVTREQLEEIAERVHRRVEGAPSPG